MSETGKAGVRWPVCTILILALLGAVAWWGYAEFLAERQTMTRTTAAAGQNPPAGAASAPTAYRTAFSSHFLAGFAVVMAAILGAIIYFWWSLKDLEGGRRYGEGEEEESEAKPARGEVSPP